MIRSQKSLVAAALTLAAQTGWAFSPYYPHVAYAPPVNYGYLRPPAATYPPATYRPPPLLYYPQAHPAPARHPAGLPPARAGRGQPAPATPEPVPSGGPEAGDRQPGTAQEKTSAEQPAAGDHRAEFLERLRPLVERENARLLDMRIELTAILDSRDSDGGPSEAQRKWLKKLARRYRVDGDPLRSPEAARELLDKVDVVPVSLALAQAANESAWGQSRFAREGNNLFGIWTYDESQGIVPRNRAAGAKHLVRRFDSIADSVRYYMFTLNSHPAYAALRALRAEQRANGQPPNGLSLADGLTRYSAKGEDYVRLIQAMIRRFDLAAFDGPTKRDA